MHLSYAFHRRIHFFLSSTSPSLTVSISGVLARFQKVVTKFFKSFKHCAAEVSENLHYTQCMVLQCIAVFLLSLLVVVIAILVEVEAAA